MEVLYVAKHFLNDFRWFKLNFPCLNFVCCCEIFQVSKKFTKTRGFACCCRNLADEKQIKFRKFLDAAQLTIHVPNNIRIELKQITFIATHADSTMSKYYLNGHSVKEKNKYEQLWSCDWLNRRTRNLALLYITWKLEAAVKTFKIHLR